MPTLANRRAVRIDMITIGQYLRPTGPAHILPQERRRWGRWPEGPKGLEVTFSPRHSGLMPISEAARADLYTGLVDVLGSDRAETLMAHLPRFDAAELATAADMAATRDAMGSLRSELKGDMGSLRSELKDDIAELRSDLNGDIGQIQDGLTAANQRLDTLFLSLVVGLFVVIATMASVVFVIR